MSNRILWFLVIVWVTGFGYLAYLIFFVSYTWTLEINSNVDNYKVKMYAKKIAKTFDYECIEKKCSLTDISPFDYNITISSPTYKDYVSELVIEPKKVNTININLIKDTKLEFIKDEIIETKNSPEVNSKIEEIKVKKQSFFNTYIDWIGYLYFKENWSNLDFYKSFSWTEDKLARFPKIEKDKIAIFQTYWADNILLINLWEDKYIYNLLTKNVRDFKLVPSVKYIKVWEKPNEYQIVTEVWTFTYSYDLWVPKYFYLFKDFVYFEDSYIWIIFKDEVEKFNNFSLKNNNKNVIIKYNSNDLQRKVILETDLDVEKIVYEWTEISFYDKFGKKYKLENF